MNTISILGIDIAQNTFQLHGPDRTGFSPIPKFGFENPLPFFNLLPPGSVYPEIPARYFTAFRSTPQ